MLSVPFFFFQNLQVRNNESHAGLLGTKRGRQNLWSTTYGYFFFGSVHSYFSLVTLFYVRSFVSYCLHQTFSCLHCCIGSFVCMCRSICRFYARTFVRNLSNFRLSFIPHTVVDILQETRNALRCSQMCSVSCAQTQRFSKFIFLQKTFQNVAYAKRVK